MDGSDSPARLYMLSFDHRSSFRRLVPDARRIPGAKRLVWDGFLRAIDEGAPRGSAGVLIDAEYGADVARDAKAGGYTLAMPVEKSGQKEFAFAYGARFGDPIEEFEPDFAKVLVRFNPESDTALNERQIEKLRLLSRWLHERRRRLLFELLVPAEPAQLGRVHGDPDRYDRELRPRLTLQAIAELQDGGVEPDIWKLEGLDDVDVSREVVRLAQRDGREHVSCVILGRAAPTATVDGWLRVGAQVAGYVGFAIGRSIFGDAVAAYAANPRGFDRGRAVETIARNYLHFVDVYDAATPTGRHAPAERAIAP